MSNLQFRKLELTDGPWIREQLRKANFQNCDYSFGNHFIWQESYHIQFADVDGFYCAVGGEDRDSFHYNYPAGSGDVKPVIEQLMADAAARGVPFRLRGMDKPTINLLETLFPGTFACTADRDYCDYIYETGRLISLAGKQLHGKRNHINRFRETNWAYEDLTAENMADCLEMNRKWCELYQCYDSPDLRHEACAVSHAFANFFELGFRGGLLRQDGRVVAFTMGEPLNADTFVVHIEKAFADVQGAYPMINQQFLEHNAADYRYVNREEDMGDEGLRKAKLSYYPDILLDKYTATISE